MADNPAINPYNFVPLRDKPERTAWNDLPKHHRLANELYSGSLNLRFFTLTPVFIPSTRFEDCDKQNGTVTFKRFNHDDDGRPILPGSSIRGMLRAVFEALTNSCMVHFAQEYGGKMYNRPEYVRCAGDTLCPACSVFGMVAEADGENSRANRSKVICTDAAGKADDLLQGEWTLKALSTPQPQQCVSFYAKDGSNPASGPRGRKFYFHHDPTQTNAAAGPFMPSHPGKKPPGKLNRKIFEQVKAGACFDSTVLFQGLQEQELADLLFALELEKGLAHKIGMGKPLGLGSVGISIVGGRMQKGSKRYQSFESADAVPPDLRQQIEALRQQAVRPDKIFHDLLACAKYKQGSIGYLGHEDASQSKTLGPLGGLRSGRPKPAPAAQEIIRDFLYNEQIHGKISELEADGRNMLVRADDGRLFRRQMQIQGVKRDRFVVGLPVVLDGNAVRLK